MRKVSTFCPFNSTVTVDSKPWPSEAVLPEIKARMARIVACVEPHVPFIVFCFEIQVSACFTDSGDIPDLIMAIVHSAVVSMSIP